MSETARPVALGLSKGYRLVAVGCAGAAVLLVVYPLVSMIVGELFEGGSFDSETAGRVLNDPQFRDAVRNTILIVLCSGGIAVVTGTTFAWLNERTDARMGVAATYLPLVPLVLPLIASCIGWIFLADVRAGYLNAVLRDVLGWVGVDLVEGPLNIMSFWGMVFLYVLWLVPFVYVLAASALRNIDPSLEEASRMSGASVRRTVWLVSMPLIRPALAGACFLVMLLGISQFSIGRTIGTTARIDVISTFMVRVFNSSALNRSAAIFVGTLVLIAVSLVWLVERRLTRGINHGTISERGISESVVRLGSWKWVARGGMIAYLLASAVIPLIALTLVALQPYWTPNVDFSAMSLSNYLAFWDNDVLLDALLNSIRIAAMSATLGMLVAALLASYSRQSSRAATSEVLDIVARAPGAIAHVVFAIALLLAFGGPPFSLAGTLSILVIAYVVLHLPEAWISANQSMRQIGPSMSDASSMSGAFNWMTFIRVNLPLMAGGLAAGWAMLFVSIVGDLNIAAILAGPGEPVVGSVILGVFDNGTFSQLAALGTTIAIVSGGIVTLTLVVGRRLDARN